MKRALIASMLGMAAFAVGTEARAQSGWGLHTGDTMRTGDNLVYGEFGWPDVALGIQHGFSDKVDLGFRLSLLYGLEYRACTGCTQLGLGMQVPIRFAITKGPKFSASLHFEPGIKFDTFNTVRFGLWLPLGFELGIHFVPEATLSFGIDMPFFLNLTNGVGASIPLLFGFGFEYHVDDHISVGLNTRFGPSIAAGSVCIDGICGSGSSVDFGFIAQAFFAYRL